MENWKWTSLVWVSKPVVLHIEEEAMSLSTNLCVVCHYFCCLRALSQGHVPCWNLPWQGRSLICHDDCKEVANIIFYWKVQALIHCVFDLQIILGKGNASLENETVKHLNIQPDHKVLEIGFGQIILSAWGCFKPEIVVYKFIFGWAPESILSAWYFCLSKASNPA